MPTNHRNLRAVRALLIRLVGLALVATTLALGLNAAPAGAAPGVAGDDEGEHTKPSLAALATPGTITGTASVEGDGDFAGWVSLYRWNSAGEYFDYWDDAEVDADSPAYSFDIEAGDFYLSFDPYGHRHLTAYSAGATEPPVTLADDGVIHVEPGDGAEFDLQAAVDPSIRQVTGTVIDGSGTPVPDVEVDAEFADDDAEWADDDYTGSDGAFTLDLASGDYVLRFFPDSSDFESTSYDVTVGDDDVEVGEIELPSAGRWTVSGTISDAAGALDDATVRLYRLYGEPGDWEDWDWVDEASVEGDGSYAFANVRGGSTRPYTVRASAPGHAPTYYGDTTDIQDADFFTLSADRGGVDVELDAASSISGVVSGPGGPAAGVQAVLYRWDEGDGDFYDWDSAYTDDDGAFAFDSLAPGAYSVYFNTDEAVDPLEPAWLGGAGRPTTPAAAGVMTVTDTPQGLDASTTLARAHVATGTVTDQSSAPVSGASVTVYTWEDDEGWQQGATDRTDDEGAFAVRVPADAMITLRAARGGFSSVFLGGGASLPGSPTAGNSITTTESDLTVGTLVLPPFVSRLGKVAGQDLAYCRSHALPANDDDSSSAVEIPFDLTFFGTSYDELFVNNNGNVTFGSDLSQYTPSDLTGATDRPIIAPFFADVDTYGAGSNVVTYGASPDGNAFCVNWADVGYFSEHDDKLNTFQLLLTKNTAGAGRVPGDFDITFNYDEVLWETGDASDGEDGLGGTSAAAGFSAGTGQTGTYVQLPGSFVNGALLDGGASSLVDHSQGSGQQGRYVFQVRNDGIVSTLGGLAGTVVRDADGDPVTDAYVQVCRSNGTGCSYAYTDGDGGFSFTALPAATYLVRVWPPSGALIGGGASVTVEPGATTTLATIRLMAPTAPPAAVSLTSNGTSAEGIPSVNYAQTLAFALDGCAGVASPTYTVTLADGRVVRDHVALAESPAGHYTASIAPLTPNTGDATISTNVPLTCGGAPVAFNVYIDPSGVVTDQWGRPIPGVTVTLMRSDTEAGTYATVPDGSTVMSESNRANPSTTDAVGYFRWDVQAGWYKVRAEKTGCTALTTPAMEVPPERIDLLMKMTCTSIAGPTPSTAPTITGQAQVGGTIRPVSAAWASPLVESHLELLRDGSPVALSGGGYTLTASDVGATFTARSTGVRPDYVQESGSGSTVGFSPVLATSAAVTGRAVDPVVTTPSGGGTPPSTGTQPAGTQKARATVTMAAPTKATAGKKATVIVTVKSSGAVPTGKVTLVDGKKVIDTFILTTAQKGKATFKVKLRPGKHQLSASYAGSTTVEPASSTKVGVKVTKPKKKGKKKGRLVLLLG